MSLLRRLHSPKPSELARKRKVDHNPPPKGKRKSLGRGTVGPKSVSPSQRVLSILGSACFKQVSVLFWYQQCSALQDYIETSLMLQYNKR